MRADGAQGTPIQSHVSPSILAYEDYRQHRLRFRVAGSGYGALGAGFGVGGSGRLVESLRLGDSGVGCTVLALKSEASNMEFGPQGSDFCITQL